MRIGILTLPLHTNYGGILQAYALQTVLKRMGHNVRLLEEEHNFKLPLWRAPIVYSKRILKNILGRPCPILYEKKLAQELPVIRQNTDCFIKQYINVREVKNFHEVKNDDYDVIIVGSDQIWRPKYFPKIEHAYLDFTNGWNVKRIAYAASFGTNEWEYTPEQTETCSSLLKKFDAVSVREESAVALCKNHLEVEAKHVLDPTMLLLKEDYIQLFEVAGTPKSPGTLLCYILDESQEVLSFIETVAQKKSMVPFRVNSKVENRNAPLLERVQPPVEQWLRGFYDAEFVITDSFHACVFAILFNKPFIALGNKKRGMSRFSSLLNMFGLQDRLISSLDEYNADCDVEWDKINGILERKRYFSNEFIVENMK